MDPSFSKANFLLSGQCYILRPPGPTPLQLLTNCHIDDATYIQLGNTRIGGLSYRQSARTLSAQGAPCGAPNITFMC